MHIAFVFKNEEGELFIDGYKRASISRTITLFPPGQYIGIRCDHAGDYIDEVKISNFAAYEGNFDVPKSPFILDM